MKDYFDSLTSIFLLLLHARIPRSCSVFYHSKTSTREYQACIPMISKGARLVLASQVIAVFVNGLAKSLQSTGVIGTAQILQGRMFITLAVNSLALLSRYPDELPLGTEDVRDLLILRTIGGICGAAGFYCMPLFPYHQMLKL